MVIVFKELLYHISQLGFTGQDQVIEAFASETPKTISAGRSKPVANEPFCNAHKCALLALKHDLRPPRDGETMMSQKTGLSEPPNGYLLERLRLF
jgi:hypothetical protein